MKDQDRLNKRRSNAREKILAAAAELIRKEGIGSIAIRKVCDEAGISLGSFYYYFSSKDELLMALISESSFDTIALASPEEDITGRITELYQILIKEYVSFGVGFMCKFFHPDNSVLQQYMDITAKSFPSGSILSRCEQELASALCNGIIVYSGRKDQSSRPISPPKTVNQPTPHGDIAHPSRR